LDLQFAKMAPIPLNVPETLRRLAKGFPIVAISRPRQAGKTTSAGAISGRLSSDNQVLREASQYE
jgi:predicted AAA+ superfamily ATPase